MGGSSKKIRDSQTLTKFFVGKTPVSITGSPGASTAGVEKARSSRGTRSSKSETTLAALRAARGAGGCNEWDIYIYKPLIYISLTSGWWYTYKVVPQFVR